MLAPVLHFRVVSSSPLTSPLSSMLLSIFAYTLLIVLLAMSNWDRVLLLLSWIYSMASRWLTTSTILFVYGLVLIYLLLVVHALVTAQGTPQKRRRNTLVPYYDENGELQGWVREEREINEVNGHHANPPKRRSSPPLRTGRTTSRGPALGSQTNTTLPNFSLGSWDGFPDHRFRCHFTRQQVEDTSQLGFYWVSDKLPGKRGSLDAVTVEKGKLSRFKCAGIIQCQTAVCTVQIAPGKNIARQTESICNCGSTLRHRSCSVEWSVVLYRDGAVFENSGAHNHSKYTHLLTIKKNKKPQLQGFVSKQPIALRTLEDEDNVNIDGIDSDEEDQDGHDSEEKGNVSASGDGMDSEDEKTLDPTADADEDKEEIENNGEEQDEDKEEDDDNEA
ncbi:hypothetical protein C8F04DRAFT_1099219 [Mycena alexandri]|uniref:Uncharacterized protein n=1 Tax=Mycena alexandri TaxID=1745969 RepID=A0AAD6SHS0_9AGAR|nr:hypothetical protein C8F04DRAFT_1123672 [Mycena alexandri]KAJ7032663.1 hypothetical protein C8F04DRAFT_1106854 [Mycena alexandri]KAJ7033590.1 hypothetical protein C8F04DRAFT_1104397 [Mycena alexandri]KAJ7035142.1 hypothetical protein C8F04DRAFT_1099219 [Mycena alexandri]